MMKRLRNGSHPTVKKRKISCILLKNMNEKYFNENETEMWTFVGCVPNGSNSAPIMEK